VEEAWGQVGRRTARYWKPASQILGHLDDVGVEVVVPSLAALLPLPPRQHLLTATDSHITLEPPIAFDLRHSVKPPT
jgi:hypothetical protein